MCTKEKDTQRLSLSLHSLVLSHLSFPHVPSRAEPASFVPLEQARSGIDPEPT